MTDSRKVAIVGGGISGLSTAWWLRARDPNLQIYLIEANERLGGVLQTESVGDYLVETSADMLSIEPPAAIELIERLGRSSELVTTSPVSERAFIARDANSQTSEFRPSQSKLHIAPVPAGFSLMLPNDLNAVINSELLDQAGKDRFLLEQHVPPNSGDQDESLEEFAVRRFGRQVYERLIQPLVSGIYTADPKMLSMQATMGRFVQLEQTYGSLIRAAQAQQRTNLPTESITANADQLASGARYDLFRAPTRGMGQLVKWIEEDMQRIEVMLNSKVVNLCQTQEGWTLQLAHANPLANRELGKDNEWLSLNVDAVVLTGPPVATADLLRHEEPSLAADLQLIQAANCAVVVLGFEQRQFREPFTGYGIVIPSYLQRDLIAISCLSNKFDGRAPHDRYLFRCFVGGAIRPELFELSDEELLSISLVELNQYLPFEGQPELVRFFRWNQAMPQYHVGHLHLVNRISSRLLSVSGLEIAGNGYNGVGIPVCIREGRAAAERIAKYLKII
jgi:oxygen-dependent protoporphyrinogen oxidase